MGLLTPAASDPRSDLFQRSQIRRTVSTFVEVRARALWLRFPFAEVLENIDEDGSGMISKKEFESIKDDPIVKEALEEIGVEPKHLLASPRAQNAHDNAFGL